MKTAIVDTSCLPDNFQDDYEEICQDLIRVRGKFNTLQDEIYKYLGSVLVKGDIERASDIALVMLVLAGAMPKLTPKSGSKS